MQFEHVKYNRTIVVRMLEIIDEMEDFTEDIRLIDRIKDLKYYTEYLYRDYKQEETHGN